MLQRIQTVYLLLALLCLGAMYFFPIAGFGEDMLLDTEGIHSIGGATENVPSPLLPFPIGYLVITLVGLLLFTILQYKRRKRQMILCRIGYLLILGLVVLIYMSISDLVESLALDERVVSYGISTYLPVVALVFLFLANRSIRKDEEMVRSLDRLR